MNFFSVILPVRNGGNLIKECINSILNQTYPHFNLIILDSGSTDGTIPYLQSLKDLRIKLILSAKPLSIEENWHRIVGIQKNEFITLIGHDDVLKPGYLSVINDLIIAHPKASLYQTHFNFINEVGNYRNACKAMPCLMLPHEFVEKALKFEIDLNGTGYMVRSSEYDKLGGIPLYPKLLFADYALWFSIVRFGPVVVSESFQFSYRIHQNTSQIANVNVYIGALKNFVDLLKQRKTETVYQESIQKYAPGFIAHFGRSIAHKMLRVSPDERNGITVKDFIHICKDYCKQVSGNTQDDLFKDFNLQLAAFIDSNSFSRFLFRKFKHFYKKPIL